MLTAFVKPIDCRRVRDDGLDAVEHVAERDKRRRRDVPVVPLELLPHVDDPVALLREAQRIGHGHFADRGLGWGLIGRDLISHGLPCWAGGEPQSAGSRRWCLDDRLWMEPTVGGSA